MMRCLHTHGVHVIAEHVLYMQTLATQYEDVVNCLERRHQMRQCQTCAQC